MAETTRKNDNAGGVQDKLNKAKDVAQDVAGKAKDALSSATETVTNAADSGAASVGGGVRSLAGVVRDRGPHEGMLGDAASTVASGLDSAGRYLQNEGVSGMAEDFTELIKRNPIPAVLIGVGIGFLLAQLTRSS